MSNDAATETPANAGATRMAANAGMYVLIALGGIALIVGAIAGFAGSAAAKKAETLNGYMVALAGPGMAGSPDIDEGYAWMWFGIIVAILGALMLIAALVVWASKQQARLR